MDQLPRSVTVEALALSPAEMRAFPRWYTDLLLRKRTDCVTIGDVTAFVDNFGITPAQKRDIERLFGEPLVTLDPPQFYTYLRLAGHVVQGKQVRRELAYVSAPVVQPRSILAKKAGAGAEARDRTDMDSFMSLMTGAGAGSGAGPSNGVHKRKKRVTFDSRPPQITEAAHRSMSELLRQAQLQEQYHLPQPAPPEPQPAPAPAPQEPEPDQPIANNQFARVNIDSVLHHGQSMLPAPPAPRKTKAGDSFIQQLTQSSQPAPDAGPQHSSQHFQHPSQHGGPAPPQLNLPGPAPGANPNMANPNMANASLANPHLVNPNMGNPHLGNSMGSSMGNPSMRSMGNLGNANPSTSNLGTLGNPTMATQNNPTMAAPNLRNPSPNPPGTTPVPPRPRMAAQLSAQTTGQFLSPQTTGQFLSPQVSGMQSNASGLQSHLQPGLQPNGTGSSWTSGMWPPPSARPKLGPQSTGSLPVSMQPGLQSQLTGPPPFAAGPFAGQGPMQAPMQGYAGMPAMPSAVAMSPQPTGGQPIAPPPRQPSVEPGMQFINSVSNPAASTGSLPGRDYQHGQAFNMENLRHGMPSW